MILKNAVSNLKRTDLVGLYNELEFKLRALDTLRCTQVKYSEFLTPLVGSYLQEETMISWEQC